MVRFCATCHKIYPIERNKCPICGLSDLPRFCTNCKKFVPDDVKRCPICGDIDLTFTIDDNKTVENDSNHNTRFFITIFITGILIGIIIFVSYFLDPCREGHTWEMATCTTPRTCSVCGTTTGMPLEHKTSYKVKSGYYECTRCGKEYWVRSDYDSSESKTTNYQTVSSNDVNYSYAITAAQSLVKDALKSPSTAKFPIGGGTAYVVKRNGDDWIVSGYVDAQNGFGAIVRENWIATFTMDITGGSKYKISNYSVSFI